MHIKPTLSRTGALAIKADQYAQLIDNIVYMVKGIQVMRYEDIGFRDENQTHREVGANANIILTQVESREIIKFILSRITEDLKKGERAYFRGFGSFTKEKTSSKKVRHPKTGKIITIPERTTVDFDPSQKLLKNLR